MNRKDFLRSLFNLFGAGVLASVLPKEVYGNLLRGAEAMEFKEKVITFECTLGVFGDHFLCRSVLEKGKKTRSWVNGLEVNPEDSMVKVVNMGDYLTVDYVPTNYEIMKVSIQNEDDGEFYLMERTYH